MLSLGPGELTLVSIALLLVLVSGRLGALGDAIGKLLRGAPSNEPKK